MQNRGHEKQIEMMHMLFFTTVHQLVRKFNGRGPVVAQLSHNSSMEDFTSPMNVRSVILQATLGLSALVPQL